MRLPEFLRLFPLRSKNLMWFLGAGASSGARIPTATDLMWSFKRSIYGTEQKLSLSAIGDLADAGVQQRIQGYLDASGRFPKAGDPDEYASLFEFTYPDPKDRRTALGALLTGARPSFGHKALAALMRVDAARVVWTTNFDRVIEDAAYDMFGGSSAVTVAAIESADAALRALNDQSFPLVVKLHGDFQSERLKNTTEELRSQDVALRDAFSEACKRFGLVVVGYSGRDHSIMVILEEAVQQKGAFPFGLFWMVRSGGIVFDRVDKVLTIAAERGIDAHKVEVETFDELLGDVLGQITSLPEDVAAKIEKTTDRLTFAPEPSGKGVYPVVRTNAIGVTSLPSVCRLVVCDIGGQRDVQEAIRTANANIVAGRRNIGVLAFGSDDEVRRAFEPFSITRFDVHQLQKRRLAYDSIEMSMLSDALARGLSRARQLDLSRRGARFRLTVPHVDARAAALRTLLGVGDIVPKTSLRCLPSLEIRLDIRFERASLLLEPTLTVDQPKEDGDAQTVKDFVREASAKLYNAKHSRLLDAWLSLLFGSDQDLRAAAFGIGDGLDAAFTLNRISAFSWRLTP